MYAIQVLYEDNHLIAVNKPAGMLVHEDETGDETLADWVKRYIKDRYGKPGDVFLGVIHRIDRPVSGLVLFARTSKALTRMNELFKQRQVEKIYWAVVEERPDEIEGRLVHYLIKDHETNRVRASVSQRGEFKDGKECVLDYRLLKSFSNHHLLEVRPLTGRPHQIRAQLSKIGCPIRGDVKYGAQRHNTGNFIHLHARQLNFVHPVKNEPISITAELPEGDQVWDLFD
jgi:23S rRNA pseudouridine1911/1915/1917 synthase